MMTGRQHAAHTQAGTLRQQVKEGARALRWRWRTHRCRRQLTSRCSSPPCSACRVVKPDTSGGTGPRVGRGKCEQRRGPTHLRCASSSCRRSSRARASSRSRASRVTASCARACVRCSVARAGCHCAKRCDTCLQARAPRWHRRRSSVAAHGLLHPRRRLLLLLRGQTRGGERQTRRAQRRPRSARRAHHQHAHAP